MYSRDRSIKMNRKESMYLDFRKQEENMKKQSIRIQVAVTTILLIAVTILICVLANALFLERIYVNNKKQNLKETYQYINEHSSKTELASESFENFLENKCEINNLKFIVLDEMGIPITYYSMDYMAIREKLILYQSGQYKLIVTLEETKQYFIHTIVDNHTKLSNMEMWGYLDNGYLFIITTPLESVAESAAVSRDFMFIIGIIAVIFGGFVAWIYSSKISTPILKLAELSEKIKALDFEAKYTGTDNNEIGILGNNMNSLSASLKQTISELKTANIELQQDIKKKEEIDEQRKEFIGNVSHELKTPIALIQGYAEGLREGITDDPESMNYYLEVISDEAERMNRMVKNLMALNELESGHQHMTMERFDLVALVRNYVGNAGVLIKDQETQLKIESPDTLYAWGDEFKIEEVVMNYFSNAVHHVNGEQKEIRISIEQLGEKARVTVFNTGANIPQEDLEHIWDKFYKVDKARTRAYGGSGVGLSIVKAIMLGLGQNYGVENREDGVAFWFELSII